jgi:hypothetical protein
MSCSNCTLARPNKKGDPIMRSLAAPALALLTVALMSARSQAQVIYPPFDDAFYRSFTMLRDDSVCKELKLGDDQIAKVDAALAPAQKHYNEETVRLHNVPAAEAERQYPDVLGKTEEAAWKALDGALGPNQMKRFRQIVFQRRGPAVFGDADVQKRLGLTDEQKAQAQKFADERQKKSDEEAAGADELARLEAEQTRKTLGLLTDEQRKVWDDLTGESFQLKPGWMVHMRKVKDN